MPEPPRARAGSDGKQVTHRGTTLLQSEWLSLGLAVIALFASGAWHLGGILGIKRLNLACNFGAPMSVLFTFWGLALLHLSEIAAGALVYAVALGWFELGTVDEGYGDSWAGLLYLSGISYATLGYTEQVVRGPLRILTMVNALGGFMLITWSATYVYSIWGEHYREKGGSD